jgi:hypothetical protein
MNKSAKIFLSHSSKDKAFVRRLANDLHSRGVPVWFDEWELKVGDSLNSLIGQGIKESGWLAVIVSNNSNKSPWVDKELNAGLSTELEKKQVYVLPIVIEDCEIPIFLKDKVFADFRDDYNAGLTALLRRLIPEKHKPKPLTVVHVDNTKSTTSVQRQTNQPRPEDSLPKITEVRIEGRHPQYSGLLVIRFKLDKTPDQDWRSLFEHPTTFTLNIHPAKVYGNEIEWHASEEDIKNKKHWIYDWLEDANKRYLPIIQTRINKQEERFRQSQLENAKLAALENLLKSGREGAKIIQTDEIMVGKCSLRLENCAASNIPGPITQVNFPNKGFIHVCYTCLQKQVDEGHWIE